MPTPVRLLSRLVRVAVAIAAPLTQAAAQASVGGRLESGLGSCGSWTPSLPSGSPTSMAWVDGHTGYGCTLSASAYAYLGIVGARARAALDTGDWSSGSIGAQANATWQDQIAPTWNSRFVIEGIDRLRLRYNVGATGVATATATPDPASGYPVGGSSAGIGYDLYVAGEYRTGSRSAGSDGSGATFGDWGTIAGVVELGAAAAGDGYTFGAFPLALVGRANAGAGKLYAPGAQAIATGEGEFGSTLVWRGIVGVEALDAAGNPIALPADFRLALTGAATGFDYWDAAPRVTATPEPGTVAPVAGGLLALGAGARRRRRRVGGAR